MEDDDEGPDDNDPLGLHERFGLIDTVEVDNASDPPEWTRTSRT